MPELVLEDALNRTRRRRRRKSAKSGSKCKYVNYGTKTNPRYQKQCPGKRPVWIAKLPKGKRAVRKRVSRKSRRRR